ncbi:oxygen-independent coproporphyrinogen III oxidase [Bacillus taeanensis]|uniref:Heme chaperone HemW n=1 Tax=Bacillus taeanensis TaxID=273032 RepID=A0A366Y255_9BACI|nr:oxygen-independent coproporphyrinogen III oxidase [Bacillus taeanensis]
MAITAAYLHIPFCEQICHYCDFNKVFLDRQPVEEYLRAMEREMAHTTSRFSDRKMKTIFVGGGTPTALNVEQLELFLNSIHRHFKLADNYEFTFEANPGNIGKDKLKLLKEAGVNRLSIGVQAFQDELLKGIGRTHRYEDIFEIVSLAYEIGIHNLSIDLMFGLPHQTVQMFQESLQKAFLLDITHVSAYSLQIEPKTLFYNLMNKGKLKVPSEENEYKMYELLMNEMERNGFAQYEISNFAKPGFESRHNLTYWRNEHYYGIGAGAHSYINGVRRVNAGPLKQYINSITETGFPYREENVLTENEKMEEEMFMGLRKIKGVSKNEFKKKYNKSIYDVFGEQVTSLAKKGLLIDNEERLTLSKQGIFLGNEVFQQFLNV